MGRGSYDYGDNCILDKAVVCWKENIDYTILFVAERRQIAESHLIIRLGCLPFHPRDRERDGR